MPKTWKQSTIRAQMKNAVKKHVKASVQIQENMQKYSLDKNQVTAIVYYTADAQRYGGAREVCSSTRIIKRKKVIFSNPALPGLPYSSFSFSSFSYTLISTGRVLTLSFSFSFSFSFFFTNSLLFLLHLLIHSPSPSLHLRLLILLSFSFTLSSLYSL